MAPLTARTGSSNFDKNQVHSAWCSLELVSVNFQMFDYFVKLPFSALRPVIKYETVAAFLPGLGPLARDFSRGFDQQASSTDA